VSIRIWIMRLLRYSSIFIIIIGFVLLSSCAPQISSFGAINIASIETDLQEDISGSNTFLLVVPNRPECELVYLDTALEQLGSQAITPVDYYHYQDKEYKGYQLVYHFQNPEQIPGQIERIKRAIVEAVIVEILPTPAPTSDAISLPPQAVGLYYNPDQLSMQIAKPAQTLSGQTWEVVVRINPLLLTGWTQEEFFARQLSEACRVSRFTYKLKVPGEIRSFQVSNETMPDFMRFSKVTIMRKNSIEWTIESDQAAEVLSKELEQFYQEELGGLSEAEQEENWQNEEFQTKLMNLLEGSVCTLVVSSSTPGPLFQALTRIVAPIIALIGGVVGIIAGLLKIRQTLKQRHDKTQV